MSNSAILVKNVSKAYKSARKGVFVRALSDVSFNVESGEIFGLIGPDGSGKTTMMRIITSLMLADSGSVSVNGFDVRKNFREIRRHTGYMPGRFSLYHDLSVEENLRFFAKIFGVKVKENMSLINSIYSQLEPFKGRLAGNLSGGMKQKLALCCALIHRPKLLVLDEPTTGVDPVSRQELWDILGDMKRHGITILVSTPYMDEAVRCDKIAFMVRGKFLQKDSPQGIISSFPKKILHVKNENMFELLNALRMSPKIESAYAFGDNNHAVLADGSADDVRAFLAQNGHSKASVTEAVATLEDCFMNLDVVNEEH